MRQARVTPHGEVHHVISRFIDKAWFIRASDERSYYLRLLGNALAKSDWSCLAYAIMSSHIHLAMVAGRGASSSWSRRVNPPFVNWYNELHDRIGPLFASRAKMEIARTHNVGPLIAYIHNNPVRAGVVDRAADTDWTSHRAYIGRVCPQPWLDVRRGIELSGVPAAELDEWVHEQRSVRRKDLSLTQIDREARRLGAIVLGTPKVSPLEVPLMARAFAHLRPNPGRIVEIVCEVLGLADGEIFDRRHGSNGAKGRAIAIQVGVAVGVTMSASGDALGITPQAASKLAGRDLDESARSVYQVVLDRVQREVEAMLKERAALRRHG
jgi:hypothetical protein